MSWASYGGEGMGPQKESKRTARLISYFRGIAGNGLSFKLRLGEPPR